MSDNEENGFSVENAFSETIERTWFGRIAEAFKGIVAGVILIVIAIFGLNQNEDRSDKRESSLNEGAAIVKSVSVDTILAENAGKLIHTSGMVDTDEVLTDPAFNVSANALRLVREVQVYQWEEDTSTKTEKQLGGGEKEVTTYSYQKVWANGLINSNSFRDKSYKNPQNVTFNQGTLEAKEMDFGAFSFPRSLARKMDGLEKLEVESDTEIGQQSYGMVSFYDGGYYIGDDPQAPQIGDMQVQFYVIEPAVVSVVAQQNGNTLQRYRTKARGSIYLLEYGTESADGMFDIAQRENTFWTWLGRAVGCGVIYLGFILVFKPISVIADFFPVVGSVIGGVFNVFSFILALIMTIFTVITA
ncbi:TMEM43 family protein [Vibrio makurazakiensis]|uniref:TMEM43 family protein n=1 Tax=Vibrio makurazakiensis TaxID=2910250 RepID=UPI003D0F88A8